MTVRSARRFARATRTFTGGRSGGVEADAGTGGATRASTHGAGALGGGTVGAAHAGSDASATAPIRQATVLA
jgi:hypothetical protein